MNITRWAYDDYPYLVCNVTSCELLREAINDRYKFTIFRQWKDGTLVWSNGWW